MVEGQRSADQRHPARQLLLDGEAELPSLRGARLQQGVGTGRAQRLRAGGADECGGAAVQDRLGRRDDHDRVRLGEAAVHAQRDAAGLADFDELRILDVVYLDAAAVGISGGSVTIVARPPRLASASSGSPTSGNRSASRTAAATSAIASPGAGGLRITESSGAGTIVSREPTSI